jgi:hypothetical protein
MDIRISATRTQILQVSLEYVNTHPNLSKVLCFGLTGGLNPSVRCGFLQNWLQNFESSEEVQIGKKNWWPLVQAS